MTEAEARESIEACAKALEEHDWREHDEQCGSDKGPCTLAARLLRGLADLTKPRE